MLCRIKEDVNLTDVLIHRPRYLREGGIQHTDPGLAGTYQELKRAIVYTPPTHTHTPRRHQLPPPHSYLIHDPLEHYLWLLGCRAEADPGKYVLFMQ